MSESERQPVGEEDAALKAQMVAKAQAKNDARQALAKQPPSVGRIVHFYAPDSRAPSDAQPLEGPYAGIITGVGPGGMVSLMTFGPSGSIYPHAVVPFSIAPEAGCWSWPPRVP